VGIESQFVSAFEKAPLLTAKENDRRVVQVNVETSISEPVVRGPAVFSFMTNQPQSRPRHQAEFIYERNERHQGNRPRVVFRYDCEYDSPGWAQLIQDWSDGKERYLYLCERHAVLEGVVW
jgi:hypothetical protein